MSNFNNPPGGGGAPGRLGIAVVGVGRVGAVLASALRAVGHHLVGVVTRSAASQDKAQTMLPGVEQLVLDQAVQQAEVLLLTVNDEALPQVIAQIDTQIGFRPNQLVIHTCGAQGTGVLAAAQRAGALPLALHPAMTFSGTSLDLARLRGCPWAVTAPSLVLPIAQALVVELDGEPVTVREDARALYHAALAHGANHLVTVSSQALRLLREAGIDQPAGFARPLLEAALDRSLVEGEAGLSGPVARGDALTVAAHLQCLTAAAQAATTPNPDGDPALPHDDLADIPEAYRALAAATAQRCWQRGGLDGVQYQRLQASLNAGS